MTTTLPSYIVAEIPEPIRSEIQNLRDSLGTLTARLPVEITLFGSSGVGPIPAGTSIESIVAEVNSIFSSIEPWEVRFDGVRVFANTSIAYLAPFDRFNFDRIHNILCDSPLPRSENEFAYNPHCTLRSGLATADELSKILDIDFPASSFTIDTISIYDFDAEAAHCDMVYSKKLV